MFLQVENLEQANQAVPEELKAERSVELAATVAQSFAHSCSLHRGWP